MTKKKDNFKEAIDFLSKKFGKDVFTTFDTVRRVSEKDVLSTGSLVIDRLTGIGGFPPGIVELFGTEGSGKSTVTYQTIAEAQKRGYKCAYIDMEHAADPLYMQTLGVDFSNALEGGNFLFTQPMSGGEALTIVDKLVKTGEIKLIVVDSADALITQSEIDGNIDDKHVAERARLVGQALRLLTGHLNKTKTTLIFINQLRDKIGVMFGEKSITPAGKALKFYAKLRMSVTKISLLKDTAGKVVGQKVRVQTKKNKLAPPFQDGYVNLIFGTGVDYYGEIVELGKSLDLIKKSGKHFVIGEEKFYGQPKLTAYLKDTKEGKKLTKEIHKRTIDSIAPSK